MALEKTGQNDKARRRVGVERKSLLAYTVDPKKLVRQLFGKEPTINEYTGELVFDLVPANPQSPRPS